MTVDKKIRLQELAHKWLNGTLTEAEQLEFDTWFIKNDTEPLNIPSEIAENKEQYKQLLFSKIQQEINGTSVNKSYKLWFRIAAVAVLVITVGIWFFKAKPDNQPVLVAHDANPGKNKAIITLPNGKKINLSDAKQSVVIDINHLKYNDGSLVSILSDKESGSNTISQLTIGTPQGGMYCITLSDGTKVWLNAGTTLRFPSTFNNQKERRVELNGEAYFEVSKNKNQPFIVKTNSHDVKVLGTHFNIESYANDDIAKTTLVEGSVKIVSSGQDIILKPEQQCRIKNGQLTVETVNASAVMAWVNGDFVFERESLNDILKKVARWYNVEIVYRDAPKNLRFDAIISRSKKLSEVLNIIETTGKVKFKIEGQKIIVNQ